MKGKSYSMPCGMVFKKYYCSKCGARLEKEKTHRIVTKDDKDYYQYHERGSFPRYNYDVYSYQFKCPSCEARISYGEQCIVAKIQKKQGYYVLSASEIKNHYKENKEANRKRSLLLNLIIPISIMLIACIFSYLFTTDQSPWDFAVFSTIFVALTIYIVWKEVRRHSGTKKRDSTEFYSYEKKAQMERLHAYCSHNQPLIDTSEKCYCFHCKAVMDRGEIESYIDEGKTALCPKCGIDSIIPDSIHEPVNESIISEMHEYWF